MANGQAPQPTRTLTDLHDLGRATADQQQAAPVVFHEMERDELGRSYATGKRKNAIARVWLKPGTRAITVNGLPLDVYFARPVLRMIINQAFVVSNRANEFDVYC